MAGRTSDVTIPSRFCGPPGSGNGGYSSGLVAAALGGTPAEVTLYRPPPLDRPLRLVVDAESAGLYDGEDLVARATATELNVAAPPAPSRAEVADAVARFELEPYAEPHPFPGCFTCGPARVDGDGLRLFPAPVGRDALVAWPWLPTATLAGDDGLVLVPVVWAALDCPGGLSWIAETATPAVLGRMAAVVHRRPAPGEDLVAGGWQVAGEGRKLRSGAAVWSADGEVLAASTATWLVLTAEQQAAFATATATG